MDNAQSSEGQVAIEQLMRTPVGRRWLLKAGFSAVAVGTVLRGASAWAGPAKGPRPPKARPTVRVLHHFALGPAASLADLRVVVNGQEVALTPHTGTTRSALRSQGTLWRKIAPDPLTHFATVSVPRDRGVLMSVHGTRGGKTVVVAQAFRAPVRSTHLVAKAAYTLERSYRSVAGSPERLAALGLSAAQLTAVREVEDLETIVDTHQTAIALAMCHPGVATVAPTEVAATKSLLGQTPEVSTLGNYIGQMHQAGQDYATLEPAVDAHGNPSQITIGTTTTTFSAFRLNKTDPTFTETARSAVSAGVIGVRDTGSLGTVLDKPLDDTSGDTNTWHQAAGIAITPTPYVPPSSVAAARTPGSTSGPGPQVAVQIQNTNLLYGTYTALNGAFAGGKVPLKLYNNYVRWISVYVQYLAADGTNLSLSDSATFPDTQFAKSLGLLPQVFTMLGVPLWDTNTIEVTLDFPPEATSARLLFCGLGGKVKDAPWRPYFPAGAYPGRIAPTDEVLVAGLLTGVVSLGLTAFALATDFDIATTLRQWNSAIRSRNFYLAFVGLEGILAAADALTGAEIFATTVVTGGATYADVANNKGDLDNLWSILGIMGSIVPKLLFNKGAIGKLFEDLAEDISEEEVASKLIAALPVIGEVYEMLAVVGDVLTLAESIGETIASPWVIENRVTLTYPATVTVSRDLARAATWPVTARSWRIEAKIDGAAALTPVTGTLNTGGAIQSDPLVLHLTAPFGGKTITWSIVVLDAAGNQVGAGAAQFVNDDASNPPSTPAFAITELPAAITPATVFRRADTTIYSPTAGGYTWCSATPECSATPDNGTLHSAGIQEVTGVAVATRLGVAGIVWKQGDKYWLRGVPVAENGTTITLGGATRQGYARRPFLLLDALVGEGDLANHVLLEPDDTEPGYHVRRLTIDPATGDLSWDPSVSLGYFTLPVSAATLHSSGHVVAIHTDSGRLGRVLPVNPPLAPLGNPARVPLASYTAGPGTQVGLLSSPTAVAVTNPGTLIVLEAAASQLAAFDLNGNPVRQFGTVSPAAFTLPLLQARTYLDVAVDGAGQIYVLSYQGDGSQPVQYRIDVFSPTGAPISVLSIGNNVPHLAVDYWRSIYAANFTALLDTGTRQPRIDPALGVAEPSLSRFDPS